MLNRLALAILVVVGAACASVPPATPTLVSISGHGVPTIQNNIGVFQFDPPAGNAATNTLTYYGGSTVVIRAPFPTSLELAINGKPLTKVSMPVRNDYQYSGDIIDATASNPATWSLGIRTPRDVPLNGSAADPNTYTLTIVDVGNSQRSAPLVIFYRNPLPPYVDPIPPASECYRDIRACSTSTGPTYAQGGTTNSTDNPPGGTSTGHCPNGAQEHHYDFCWKSASTQPYTAGTSACSESEALTLLLNSYPGFTHASGACP